MSTRSKSSESKTLSQFDRGSIPILNHFPTLNKGEIITIQLMFFSLLELLSLKLTDNDPIKSNYLFNLFLQFLQSSKLLPASLCLSSRSIRQLPIYQNYVRMIQQTLQTALNVIQRPSSSTNGSTITNILEKDYAKVLTTPNLNIGNPQTDIQLKIPLALTMNGTITTNGFDNIVIHRYVQDFYEIDKLGKGAFGSVFRARNLLDDRMYAIKKIVFNENTDRTRRQAKRALREVRVLASLSHPNIVQYHCAWLELVTVETRMTQPTTTTSSLPSIKKPVRHDSMDDIIQFEEQSLSKDQIKSLQKSSTSQDDDTENSVFSTNDHEIVHRSHSDGDNSSLSSLKILSKHSTQLNKELIPLEKVHQINQINSINSKIVLFIQMQLCDTTLYDWLRYRDHTIIQEISDDEKKHFYSLNDLGQRQCWHIFKQLLTAVEYLHSQSFVHRDIKPRNIFLAYDSKDASSVHVKLGDFGLATIFDSETTSNSSEQFQNDDSSGVGTALYAPPEQLNSHHCIATSKSDSYSLGIVLFELFNIFPTEMERYCCLSDLRIHMKVDEQFSKYYPFESKIIEQLVLIERDKRLNVEELLKIYSQEIQQRMKKQQINTKQMIIEQLQEKLHNQDKRIQQLEFELEKNKL